MRISFLALVALLVATLGSTPGHAEKRAALVIGNGGYRSAPALLNPKHDAEDIGRALRELGFETIVATDLDRSGMNDVLDRFSRIIAGAEMALVYYSGHGMQFAGKNFLLPVDARLVSADDVNKFRLLPLDDIFETLSAAQRRLVVLDACRNNPVEEDLKRRLASLPGANRDAYLSRGLGRIPPGNGLIVAYSTQANDVAGDGVGRNSPFTAAFLKHVGTPDIDVRQMLFRVQDDVARHTHGRQRPELSLSPIREFKLRVSAAPSTPVPPAQPPAKPIPPAFDARAMELTYWESVRSSTSPAILQTYLDRYPEGTFSALAKARIQDLHKPLPTPPQPLPPRPPAGTVALPPAYSPMPSRPARPRSSSETCAVLSGSAGDDRYCASSTLSPQFGNSYGVRNLFSGDTTTAWVEGVSGQGRGQWIIVEFDGLRSVQKITIQNGYQKNTDIFRKNSRVRQLRLVFSQGETKVVSLEDRTGTQTITLDSPIKAYWVQLVIDDVFAGWKYEDTVISKLFVTSRRLQ